MDYGSLSLEAMAFSDLYPFLISILIGALVGTERERDLLEKKKRGVAGLRTFILITLLGTLSAAMAADYGGAFIIVAFASFALMAAVGYAASATNLGRRAFPSEVAAAGALTLGALCPGPAPPGPRRGGCRPGATGGPGKPRPCPQPPGSPCSARRAQGSGCRWCRSGVRPT